LFLLRLVVENSIAYLQDTKQNKQAKPDFAVQSILMVDCITIVHRKLHCGFMRLHQNNHMKQNQT
jgi:hypothetical protein